MGFKRPCLTCGTLTRNRNSLCPTCGTTTARGYGTTWQTRATTAIADHRATHGDWCPGWPTGQHAPRCNPTDLVLDHDGTVMSRACNSRKAATTDKQRRRPTIA